jgi:hypothetical protein
MFMIQMNIIHTHRQQLYAAISPLRKCIRKRSHGIVAYLQYDELFTEDGLVHYIETLPAIVLSIVIMGLHTEIK